MTIDDALTCKEVVELVTEYLENVLLPGLRKQFEEHVADCPGCTNYIEQVRLTVAMLHQLAQEPVFPETKQELLEAFRNWKRGSSPQEADTQFSQSVEYYEQSGQCYFQRPQTSPGLLA